MLKLVDVRCERERERKREREREREREKRERKRERSGADEYDWLIVLGFTQYWQNSSYVTAAKCDDSSSFMVISKCILIWGFLYNSRFLFLGLVFIIFPGSKYVLMKKCP